MKHRSWQKTAFKVVERCNSNAQHNIIPVNACVGSGKTNVAAYAIGDFIMKNKSSKTAQMFITPRIRLCAQQAEEIASFLEAEFNLKNGKDFDIIRKDCTQHDLDLKSKTFSSQHAVFVVCDESLWGLEQDGSEKRWNKWMNFLSKLTEEKGYLLGNAVFDEAHNFTANRDKVYGEGAIK